MVLIACSSMRTAMSFEAGSATAKGAATRDISSVTIKPRRFINPLLSIPIMGYGIADPPHPLALLRARRERPRRHAAEQRDELAPFHCPVSPVLPNERNSTPRYCCAAGFRSDLCRRWVKSARGNRRKAATHVRSYPMIRGSRRRDVPQWMARTAVPSHYRKINRWACHLRDRKSE